MSAMNIIGLTKGLEHISETIERSANRISDQLQKIVDRLDEPSNKDKLEAVAALRILVTNARAQRMSEIRLSIQSAEYLLRAFEKG